MIIVKPSFSKSSVFKVFCVRQHVKLNAAFSNSSGLKSVSRKALFSGRISVDGRPNRRNKAAFSNSPYVVWRTLPAG